MDKKVKKINGAVNVDSPAMEAMRATVVEQELSARSWKAYYEKMYYAIEGEKLEAEYNLLQERMKKRLEEQRQKEEAFMKMLNEQIKEKNQADPGGDIKLEEEN